MTFTHSKGGFHPDRLRKWKQNKKNDFFGAEKYGSLSVNADISSYADFAMSQTTDFTCSKFEINNVIHVASDF